MEYRSTLEGLLAGRSLDASDAQSFLAAAIDGGLSDVQLTAILVALQAKGPTGVELAAFTRALRSRAVLLNPANESVVDTCGTGGGAPSFNLSTASAIVAASAGAKIAKHGNRAVTSQCGSADVLEALGVRLTGEPEALEHLINAVGIAFLFAPYHHPALKSVGPLRKEIGVRTVFNLLGPLASPALVRRQVVGVYSSVLIRPMAEALLELGAIRALVVHGRDGLDEISPCAPTIAAFVDKGSISEVEIDLAHLGRPYLSNSALNPGSTVAESAAIVREALSNAGSDRAKATLPGAGAALWVSGLAGSLKEGIEMAETSIAQGQAHSKLEQLIEASQGL